MDFKPTWLYIKQHNISGIKYFGKTIRDPNTYLGSGLYWIRHLKKYGQNISTIWARLFTNKEELIEFALKFSQDNNIVQSKDWANLKVEDGLMGGDTGITKEGRRVLSEKSSSRRHSIETKEKIRNARKLQTCPRTGKKHSYETIQKIKEKRAIQKPRIGYSWSTEQKAKFKSTMLERPRTGYSCFYSWSDKQRKKFKSTILERKLIRVQAQAYRAAYDQQ